MRIAVVGARLAGSYASLLLSQQGHEVWLFDPTTEKEKPCGGGVTGKALLRMPLFRNNRLPHTEIRTLRILALDGRTSDVTLRNPIHIFARRELDNHLREASVRSGTRFLPQRATKFAPVPGGWVITTPEGEYEADFLIGADGATSSVRACTAGRFRAQDLSLALGYYLPGMFHQDRAVAVFQEKGFHGYIWSFPRVDHTSVGILRWLPDVSSADLRRRVQDFIDQTYPETLSGGKFYAARIPCLSRQTLAQQRVCGRNWALLGDAAGFVDPITAEGIFFALRSAELLAEAFARGTPSGFEVSWRSDFGHGLMRAAGWRQMFYEGSLLLRPVTRRVIDITSRSPTLRMLTDGWISGEVTYAEIRRQIFRQAFRIVTELCSRKGGLPNGSNGGRLPDLQS